MAASFAARSKSEVNGLKSDFRSTPETDIADQVGHVGFVPTTDIALLFRGFPDDRRNRLEISEV
jgi:hypothetical protein